MKNMTLTPASIDALTRGDLENFVVAATPGGIEAQEAAGQAMFCANSTLPKDCPRIELEKLGVVFGSDQDDLFVNVQLPKGWKKQATDHSMWSELLDEKGRRRGGIFYKAAFYDRKASMSLDRRYRLDSYMKGSDKDHEQVAVTDGDRVVQCFGEYKRSDWAACKVLEEQARAWLQENLPEWQSTSAYWD